MIKLLHWQHFGNLESGVSYRFVPLNCPFRDTGFILIHIMWVMLVHWHSLTDLSVTTWLQPVFRECILLCTPYSFPLKINMSLSLQEGVCVLERVCVQRIWDVKLPTVGKITQQTNSLVSTEPIYFYLDCGRLSKYTLVKVYFKLSGSLWANCATGYFNRSLRTRTENRK